MAKAGQKKKSRKKSVLTAQGLPLQVLRLNPLSGLDETGVPARWSKMICTQLQIMKSFDHSQRACLPG